jgi:hypothetical protein
MRPNISSQLKAYEDFLLLENFSLSTHKMYLRTLKNFLKCIKRKFPRQPIDQELAK